MSAFPIAWSAIARGKVRKTALWSPSSHDPRMRSLGLTSAETHGVRCGQGRATLPVETTALVWTPPPPAAMTSGVLVEAPTDSAAKVQPDASPPVFPSSQTSPRGYPSDRPLAQQCAQRRDAWTQPPSLVQSDTRRKHTKRLEQSWVFHGSKGHWAAIRTERFSSQHGCPSASSTWNRSAGG